MTPSGPTSNSFPRHVTCDVKKLRPQIQKSNPSRTGMSQRSDSMERPSRIRCAACKATRASNAVANNAQAAVDGVDTAAASRPITARGRQKLMNRNRKLRGRSTRKVRIQRSSWRVSELQLGS